MGNKDLYEKLYNAAVKELAEFENSLDTVEKALNAAYELSVKRDILSYIENELNDITSAKTEAAVNTLIDSGSPLSAIYDEWLGNEYDNRMEAIKMTTDDIIDITAEKAADRERYENNIIIQTRFPHVDNRYPNDITYNGDSHIFSWVYFNEEGDGGDGEFIDITVTEDDVLAAYNSENFLEYIYQNCKQNVIDTHSGYFEDYANAYINPNNDVVRRYQELTIQAYLEEHTPAVQKAKKSLEGEISAESNELIIDGYEGTWYVVDTEIVDGKEIFLLENEEYGDETFGIIIDKDRNVLVDEAWNGFADYHEKYDNLTPEEKLANKVTAEWNAFLEDMKKESPAVLIESAYEITTKDNIQTYIAEENLDLTENQLNSLLSRENILDELYADWNHNEFLNGYSDVAELLKQTADKIGEAIDRENLLFFRKETYIDKLDDVTEIADKNAVINELEHGSYSFSVVSFDGNKGIAVSDYVGNN